jgi:hypothetical protein
MLNADDTLVLARERVTEDRPFQPAAECVLVRDAIHVSTLELGMRGTAPNVVRGLRQFGVDLRQPAAPLLLQSRDMSGAYTRAGEKKPVCAVSLQSHHS